MLIEESPNLLAVILKLIFQSVEELDQCERQSALGSSDGRRTAKLVGLGKDFQSLLVELWTIEMMHVQELLPFPASGLWSNCGVGNCCTKSQLGVAVQSSKACNAAG